MKPKPDQPLDQRSDQPPAQRPDQRPDDDPPLQGEGNYAAGRRYDKAQREFVKAGKVDEAAHGAQPKDAHEQQELTEAEKVGRLKARK